MKYTMGQEDWDNNDFKCFVPLLMNDITQTIISLIQYNSTISVFENLKQKVSNCTVCFYYIF